METITSTGLGRRDTGETKFPLLRVGPEVTQCIQELSRANEDLRQSEEKLRARIAALEKQILLAEGNLNSRGSDHEVMGKDGLALETVSLRSLVYQVIREMAESIVIQKAEIHVAEPLLQVEANPGVLHQVLFNVIDNALKFVAPGTAPRLYIWAQAERDTIKLYVADQGIGIAGEHQKRIFDLFERVNESYPGNGLGLALARKGIEQMGGCIGVESEPGKGSHFWIELSHAR